MLCSVICERPVFGKDEDRTTCSSLRQKKREVVGREERVRKKDQVKAATPGSSGFVSTMIILLSKGRVVSSLSLGSPLT